MRESHGEGLARHTVPESCGGVREDAVEALTGAHTGQVLSREIPISRDADAVILRGRQHGPADTGKAEPGPARSQTLHMCGNSLHGNREIPPSPTDENGTVGRSQKVKDLECDMHGGGKSDDCIVPEKSPNRPRTFWELWEQINAPLARMRAKREEMEGRRSTEGNAEQTATGRTQSRYAVSPGLQRVRNAARRDKRAWFTCLLPHVTAELLRESYRHLKKDAAPGVDELTWEQYGVGLEDRLLDLHTRVHTGRYRAQPSKRIYQEKPDGRLRPIGIAVVEDKVVQHAVVKVLSAIYEEDFLGFSYGFRPGRSQHYALDALWVAIMEKKVNWVLDADIRSFFDTINHEWLLKFIEHRIADPRMIRLIAKWLKAGVSEDGQWSATEVGTPQGAVISPLLANIYLHYVLDLWVKQWRERHAAGDCVIVRYADDFVMGFQHQHEAEQFMRDLKIRLERFGLSLHSDKTRLIEFGRHAGPGRRKRGEGKPETFDFQGFTHICGKRRKDGGFVLIRKTMAKRLRARLRKIWLALKKVRYKPIMEQGQWLQSVVRGYLNYHAVPGNNRAINSFRYQVKRYWLQALRGRSQKHRMTWDRFERLEERWLPRPTILHPYPNVRFHALHPR